MKSTHPQERRGGCDKRKDYAKNTLHCSERKTYGGSKNESHVHGISEAIFFLRFLRVILSLRWDLSSVAVHSYLNIPRHRKAVGIAAMDQQLP